MSESAAALQTAVQANHFGVVQVHNLKETMNQKGVAFDHEWLIFEVCQSQQAKKVLDENMSVTTLLALFNTPQLKAVAQEAEDTMVKIMTEAAAG